MQRSMLRAAAGLAVAASAVAFGASGAGASPPDNSTTHRHKVIETFVDVFPTCEDGSLYEITTTSNGVEHETVSDSGGHFTFTDTGRFTAVALDPADQDASGTFTVWGGFNENPGGSVEGTFTFSVRGQYADGTPINFQTVEHFNQQPDGTVHEFFHCHD